MRHDELLGIGVKIAVLVLAAVVLGGATSAFLEALS